MANVVLLFGHGKFDPKEQPPKVAVPSGCKFCLFARHKEEIMGTRMTHLSYYISRYNIDAMAKTTNLLAYQDFKDEMLKEQHLRRIKTGGDPVHNYRLFPPAGLTHDLYDEEAQTGVKLVTVDNEDGVTLQSLFQAHGAAGTVLMWIACRAVNGVVGHGVDGYGLPCSMTEIERSSTGAKVPVHHRAKDYFKGSWPTQ